MSSSEEMLKKIDDLEQSRACARYYSQVIREGLNEKIENNAELEKQLKLLKEEKAKVKSEFKDRLVLLINKWGELEKGLWEFNEEIENGLKDLGMKF